MKVGIITLNSFNDYALLENIIEDIKTKYNISITEIISSDSLIEEYSRNNNIIYKEYSVDDKIKEADCIISIWDGKNRKIKNTLKMALNLEIDCYIWRTDINKLTIFIQPKIFD